MFARTVELALLLCGIGPTIMWSRGIPELAIWAIGWSGRKLESVSALRLLEALINRVHAVLRGMGGGERGLLYALVENIFV